MARHAFVLLLSIEDRGPDEYQKIQGAEARAGAHAALAVEVAFAPGFDQLRVLRSRLRAQPPVDAVIVEPFSLSSADLLMKEIAGKCGLVLLNLHPPDLEARAALWREHAFGTISNDQRKFGEIQARQIAVFVKSGQVLCVTGPERATAAVDRLAGLKAQLLPAVTLLTTEAGAWAESAGAAAFDSWYGVYRSRTFQIDVVAAQSDELAMGARAASQRLANTAHRQMFAQARFLGIDACPDYGRRLVDAGQLAASVTTSANTGAALRALQGFWDKGQALPLRALTQPTPYPLSSAPA